jgi:hypothetical protein
MSITGTLSLLVARNGTKLEKTSLSTDGAKAPVDGHTDHTTYTIE